MQQTKPTVREELLGHFLSLLNYGLRACFYYITFMVRGTLEDKFYFCLSSVSLLFARYKLPSQR